MSDDWVFVGSDEYFSMYYKSSSVTVDQYHNIFYVKTKREYTEKGKIKFFKDFVNDKINKQKYTDLSYSVGMYLLNYKQLNHSFIYITGYSKSGYELFKKKYPLKWVSIIHDSMSDILLNKLLQDDNILT
jgi:hypothetical protein